jgi:hypothetical protein
MKKTLFILILTCLIALPAAALAKSQPNPKEMAQRIKAAEQYWQLTHTHDRILETMQRVATQLPPDKQKAFMDRAGKFFGPQRMAAIKKQWLDMAAQVFTAHELKALVAFYGSKEGKSIREKMPRLLEGNAKIVGGEMTAFIKTERERMAKEAAAQAKKAAPPKAAEKSDKK